ncbi:MAG: RDD family protein [Candidatus Heimdallarchaeota archaeon]|nr:RDD family protein [Candidatus Heimdallarchaeota archaeon]
MSSENDLVELYIQKVDYWLPQQREMKKRILENLEEEVLEAIKDKGVPDPVIAYGDPYHIAKGLSLSQDWDLAPASWLIRSLAFIVDILLIMSVCFAYLLFGLVLFFGINIDQALNINEIGEVFEILRSDLEIASFLLLGFFLLFYVLGAVAIYSSYFVVLEKCYSATIGKKLLGMTVVDISGVRLTWKQSFVRNFTKLPGIIEFLPFDIILGMLNMDKGQGEYQRGTELLADTIVVRRG